jgi:hypothetical protein
MRKEIVGLAGAALLLALTVGVASGSPGVAGHEALATCGTLYSPPCPPPPSPPISITISGPTTSTTPSGPTTSTTPSGPTTSTASCLHTGTFLHFPITVRARAGLRSVTVFLGKKRIKTITYKGKPKTKRFSVTIATRGLKPGVYTLTVNVRNVKGKTTSNRAQFTICK